MFSVCLFLVAASVSALQNPGFEAAQRVQGEVPGWKVSASKTAGVSIRTDRTEFKEGKQSLLLEADQPADVALTQEIFLPVGSLWRAKAWIKRNLLAPANQGRPGGRIEIQAPAGSPGESPSTSGNAPWRQEEVIFRVPSPGRVSIALVGPWQGTGKVWFDGVSLEELPSPTAEEVQIRFQKLSRQPIDLKQGGQFIEVLCHLIPSMIAQQVASTSFEDEPAWKVTYKREIDKPYRPWYPDGAVHLASYSLDTGNPFNGKRSQKIALPVRVRAGISQDGFYLQEGLGYRLHLHMRSQGDVEVWASLRGGGGVVAGPVPLGHAGAKWQSAEATLTATRTLENATLNIEFAGPGTLWLDRVYLIGEDAVLGIWRPDVVAALKAMQPGVIRFGGSTMEVFEWDKCIGPWDERAPYTTPWGGLEPNLVGVEEFIQLCRYVGAEPLICVHWTGKTPRDAAAEVEYFNGGEETRWGRIRARNGHPEPYHVKYWQIGNEVGGPKYDASVKAFAEAMRKVDPTIKVLSSFPSSETLREGGGYLDYLCPHHYECADLQGKAHDFDTLREQIQKYARGKDVRVAVTEWNSTGGEFGLGRGMLETLGNALTCSRYQNLLHRYADAVEIAVRSNLSDSFGSGVIQSGPGWLYLTPTYYSQQFYQRSAGTYPLRIERSSRLPWYLQEPDLSATISEDGKTFRVYGVNSTGQPLALHFRLDSFPSAVGGGRVYIVEDREHALDSEVMNTRDDPERVKTVSSAVGGRGGEFDCTFDPYSLTLLELEFE
jgi:alpha-N-arabinofuranosidase